METIKLTSQQSLRIARLPDVDRVVGFGRGAAYVRKSTGEMLRIQQDGRLTLAPAAVRREFARRVTQVRPSRGVAATTPYTRIMD
jgi:hypothetical protein